MITKDRELILNLIKVDNLEICFGPKNSVHPREKLSEILEKLFLRNKFLREDYFYVEFLEVVGGLSVDSQIDYDDPEYYFANIYDLDGVLSDDSMAEITDGFFVFSEISFKALVKDVLRDITCAYAFDSVIYLYILSQKLNQLPVSP